MRRSYPPSPELSHSNELESRVTTLEVRQDDRHTANEAWKDDINERLQKIGSKLSLHEKAILGIIAALQVLAQDKWPMLAGALKGLLK